MEKKLNITYILLGGNIGNVAKAFREATDLLSLNVGRISNQSKLYKSDAWGFESSDQFINQVLEIETELSSHQLLNETQEIEQQLGRVRNPNQEGFESRIIDVDILYFNSEIINSPELTIPHYAMHQRKFTLLPLSEIAPQFTHPIFNKNSISLLDTCEDNSTVTPI